MTYMRNSTQMAESTDLYVVLRDEGKVLHLLPTSLSVNSYSDGVVSGVNLSASASDIDVLSLDYPIDELVGDREDKEAWACRCGALNPRAAETCGSCGEGWPFFYSFLWGGE